MDFTDSSNPIEIGYFDRGPISEDSLGTGGFWSVYFYEGVIYGTEIVRGLDVFKLVPSEYPQRQKLKVPIMLTQQKALKDCLILSSKCQ